jgi:hypothetical protein
MLDRLEFIGKTPILMTYKGTWRSFDIRPFKVNIYVFFGIFFCGEKGMLVHAAHPAIHDTMLKQSGKKWAEHVAVVGKKNSV